eukprot:1158921-Pelagomonas_calceolata.AAC.7
MPRADWAFAHALPNCKCAAQRCKSVQILSCLCPVDVRTTPSSSCARTSTRRRCSAVRTTATNLRCASSRTGVLCGCVQVAHVLQEYEYVWFAGAMRSALHSLAP